MALLWSDEGLAVATFGNVAVTVLRQPATGERLRRLRRDLVQLYERHPGKVASMTILEAGAFGSTPEDVRAESIALMRESHVFAAAIVIEGKGFRLAALRALLAGLGLVSRPRHEQKVFENIDAAADWLVELMTKNAIHEPSRQDLVAGIEQARASISLQSPT
jgi:hypothetical protein